MDVKPVRTSFLSQAACILDEQKCCFGQGLEQHFSNPDAGSIFEGFFFGPLSFQKIFTGLAKRFIQSFPRHLTEDFKETFWPT